jgi:hypothetical protein
MARAAAPYDALLALAGQLGLDLGKGRGCARNRPVGPFNVVCQQPCRRAVSCCYLTDPAECRSCFPPLGKLARRLSSEKTGLRDSW